MLAFLEGNVVIFLLSFQVQAFVWLHDRKSKILNSSVWILCRSLLNHFRVNHTDFSILHSFSKCIKWMWLSSLVNILLQESFIEYRPLSILGKLIELKLYGSWCNETSMHTIPWEFWIWECFPCLQRRNSQCWNLIKRNLDCFQEVQVLI